MASPAPLPAHQADLVEQYCQAVAAAGLRLWRSTRQAAQTFCRRLDRNGGWAAMTPQQRLAATKVQHAAPFVAWLIVTGHLQVDAGFLVTAGLRLGSAAARYQPAARRRFEQATARLAATKADTALQWHMLAMVAAVTGTTPGRIDTERFLAGRALLLDAYRRRGWPESGRGPAAVLHRLQATLYHDQVIDTLARPGRIPVRQAGWDGVAGAYAQAAHRYLDQVAVSLRPSTVHAVERDLRQFGHWLAQHAPEVGALAQLTRAHVEAYKRHLALDPRPSGPPLAKPSIRTR
jgi:integrase/recombinase XerD